MRPRDARQPESIPELDPAPRLTDRRAPPRRPPGWARWRYRANLLWDRGTWPVLLAVGSLTLLVVIVSTVVLVATRTVFTSEHGTAVSERFWQSLLRVIDPGTMATDVGWGPRLLSLMVTISGIVLFGTLIGTISTTMQARLDTLRRGRTIVLESGHLLILGWSPWIGLLIDDLRQAADAPGPGAIVILANEDRATMEEALRGSRGNRRDPRLICRNGDPTVASELHRVTVREARTVVAVGSEAATSDATVAATVLAVGVACDGFGRQTVVAEIDDPAAAEALREACDRQVEVVGDDVVGDVLAMWMVNPGAAELLRELLSFKRTQLGFYELPESHGRSFRAVEASVQDVRPIGIRRVDGTISLAPAPETVIAPGDLLVCLTEGSPARWEGAGEGSPARWEGAAEGSPARWEGAGPPARCRGLPPAPRPTAATHLMLIGWNRIAPGLLLELDHLVCRGSTLFVLCDADFVAAEEIAVPALERMAVQVTRVAEPELELVASLAQHPCSAIAVLANQGLVAKEADAITLATLMAVRRASTTLPGDRPFVVAEFTDEKHADLAAFAGAHETVARSGLLGDALAFAVMSPDARPILDVLQGPTGPSVKLIPAPELGLVGEHRFSTVAARAYEHGLLAVGTRSRQGTTSELRLCVRRSEVLRLGDEDEVAVIA
jgi:ion channel POLLUX/CASTOR